MEWPYENETGKRETLSCDVLVLGGGMAGCFAAIEAKKKNPEGKVILVEKGGIERSGAAGSGVDHWETACTNPCCKVSPKEMAEAYIDEQDHFSNGIYHYITARESWDRLADLETYGAKIRDTEGDFIGAPFRDEKTGLMFAYDYENCYTLRVYGTTFKPALKKQLLKLGVKLLEHTEAVSLLVDENVEKNNAPFERKYRGVGALGMDVHTGKLYVIQAKAVVLCMSRPARIWLFNPDMAGLSEFRPLPSIGTGHAMGYRAGMEFTMMEKSVRAEFSAAGRSFPPYSAGNNHNTWYAATMVDARGVEIPYVDRDGNELKSVKERYYPAKGQKFFLKGGVIDEPKYEYRGPETLPFEELMKRGYRLPFYADLSKMPEFERKVIFGMMVGQEGKTKIPVLKALKDRGFDSSADALQSYGTGWQSASFLDQERQLFGAPGGIIEDWNLMSSIENVYAAGDQLYGSDCCASASATGGYAGRKAMEQAAVTAFGNMKEQNSRIESEIERLYRPLKNTDGMDWRELNMAIAKAMQNYCGGIKNEDLLQEGMDLLDYYEKEIVPTLYAANPHELMRCHEVMDILTVAQMILHACSFRKTSCKPLCFERSDESGEFENCFITIHQEDGNVIKRCVPLDYYGDVEEEYERYNSNTCSELSCNGLNSNNNHDAVNEEIVTGENIPLTFRTVGSSLRPIRIDGGKCIGCNTCVRVCQCDCLVETGSAPVMAYPGECWYCGSCVMECPKDAISLHHPLMNETKFVRSRQK